MSERWVPFLGVSVGYTPARFFGDDLLPDEPLRWVHGGEVAGSLGVHYLLTDARVAISLRGHADVYSHVRLYGLQLGTAYWFAQHCAPLELGIGAAAGYVWAGHANSEIEATGATIDGWSAKLEAGVRYRPTPRVTVGLGATVGVMRLTRPGAEVAGDIKPHTDTWVLHLSGGPQLEVRFPGER